ncbi:MAG TPA: carbon storage regulator [Pirellulales bacterium]|jgi:carbon storage regulator|nr:carbon storage regulator [Pirellulales bacterium]
MLVLSRKLGEAIVVPQCDLSVAVVDIQGNRVRLGISAPPQFAVHREEVLGTIPGKPNGTSAVGNDPLEALADELTATAYQTALRHQPGGSRMNLESELARAMKLTLNRWKRRLTTPSPVAEIRTRQSPPARLPR